MLKSSFLDGKKNVLNLGKFGRSHILPMLQMIFTTPLPAIMQVSLRIFSDKYLGNRMFLCHASAVGTGIIW